MMLFRVGIFSTSIRIVSCFRPLNYHRRTAYRKTAMVEESPQEPSTLPKLSATEFKILNRMATHMDYYVRCCPFHLLDQSTDLLALA